MLEEIQPYSSTDLHQIATTSQAHDPLRVLATYADPNNWKQVNAKDERGVMRCYWSWSGPTIVGYELAGWGVAAAEREKELNGEKNQYLGVDVGIETGDDSQEGIRTNEFQHRIVDLLDTFRIYATVHSVSGRDPMEVAEDFAPRFLQEVRDVLLSDEAVEASADWGMGCRNCDQRGIDGMCWNSCRRYSKAGLEAALDAAGI